MGKTERIELRVEPFTKELIEEFADVSDQTESEVIRSLINDAIDQFGGKMRVRKEALEKRIKAEQGRIEEIEEKLRRKKNKVESMKEEWADITEKSWNEHNAG